MKKKLTIIVFLLVGMLSLFCSNGVIASDFPVTVTDDLGVDITIEEKPQRIVSMAPNITEMLYSLGLGDRIIGVSNFADYPEEAKHKEKIGGVTEPNVEKIVSLKPDLVFAAEVNKMAYVDRLKELGVKVAGFSPSSIDETIITIKKVGKLSGERFIATRITENMTDRLNKIDSLVSEKLENNKRPGVFYEIWHDPLMTAGDGTFIDDLIERAGGENIGAIAGKGWPQFSLEKMLSENPDVYISSHHSDAHTFTVEGLKNRPNYNVISAVQNDRVYFIPQNIMTRPSPRVIMGLKELVKAIWPDIAEEVGKI